MSKERHHSPENALVPRLLVRIAGVAVAYPRLVLCATAVLVGLSIFLACTQLSFLTQRNDLVSPDKDYQKRWQQYVTEFGDDDDMVVVVRGKERAKMERALDELANKLQKQPNRFGRIFHKVDLRTLRNRALLYLPTSEIREIQGHLKDMNLLLEPPLISGLDPLFSWKSLTLTHLLGEAERRVYRIDANGVPIKANERFFLQLANICDSASASLANPKDYRNPWRSILPDKKDQQDLMAAPQYFFSGDGSLAFLLARPAKDTSSFTSAQDSIAEMRRLLDGMRAANPELEFGLTGLPVLENDEMMTSQSDTQLSSWLALIGVAVLYLVVYRCLRYPLLTLSTLIVGMLLTLGWLTVTIGHLNILSATFAVMLIGLGDFGVLWITRFEQERNRGLDVGQAIQVTTLHVGPSIVTASLTTAIAFFTALLVDFRAVAELGWIAGSGVLLCALSCFTFLPALVCLIDGKSAAQLPQNSDATRTLRLPAAWLPILTRRPRLILAIAVFVTIVCGYYAARVKYDNNLLHLQARGLDSVKWELTLVEHTAGAGWHALSSTSTPEEALSLKKRYEKLPCVSLVVEAASLVPSDQELKVDLLKDIHHRLRRLPPRGVEIPHARPDPKNVRRQVGNLLAELRWAEAAAPNGTVAVLCQRLRKLDERLQKTDVKNAAARLQKFEQILTRDLAEDLHQLHDVSTPEWITTADFPAPFRERYVGKSGKWLLRVFGAESLWEFPQLEHFVAQIRTVDADVTGKPISTLEGLRSMQRGFQWACVYAFFAMIIVLLLDFRNLWHTLLALAPLAIGMIVSMGLLGLLGIPLNPANMIALPLILGVGADNGVHIVHDYLSNRQAGRYALSFATGRGILVAALTTIFGFGTLMISHHRGLSDMGKLLTIGVGSCLAAALLFLPALISVVGRPKTDPKSQKFMKTVSKSA